MEKKIIALLDHWKAPDAKNYGNLPGHLARSIEDLEASYRVGDVTYSTLDRKIYENNIQQLQAAKEHAEALLQSPFAGKMRPQLSELLWELDALKKIMRPPVPRSRFPKKARSEFCVAVIIVWKVIKQVETIPSRWAGARDGGHNDFTCFLEELLSAAGGHVATISPDELHRNILTIAKELGRLKNAADRSVVEWVDEA